MVEGRSVQEIMDPHNISEQSFYRINKANIEEDIKSKENTYRLRKILNIIKLMNSLLNT